MNLIDNINIKGSTWEEIDKKDTIGAFFL